jgi:hypothetical protein
MRFFRGILFAFLLFACSSSDNTNIPPDDNPQGTDIVLSQKWEFETSSYLPQSMVYDKQERPYFYLAAKGGGLIVFSDQQDEQPTQVASIPIGDLFSLHVMNIFQKENYLYLALGDFFGENSKAGLAIVNISNPESPTVEDIWKSDDVIEGSAIVIVEGNYAYLGAMKHGLYIFDVSNPSEIIEKSNYVPNIDYPVENPGNAQIPNARGMTIVSNTLYLCYDAGGIRIIDVSNKELPIEIAKFHNFESIENTPKAYNNIIINGNLAYCAVDYCGFEIWDISTLGQEELIGWWNPWQCESLSNLWWNSLGHANQMVFDATNNLVFVNSGRSDLSILDVSNAENPTLKKSFGNSEDTLATWGITVHNNDIYLLYIAGGVPIYSDWNGIKKLNWSFSDN